MELTLNRPLVILDVEATGDQINKDRIVEICMIKLLPSGEEITFEKKINPEIPIPIHISEIHGIYDIDIKNSPTFKEVANEILSFIKDCDLGGFNSNKFDIPLLEEEFLRAGIDSNLEEKKLIDVQNIFHKLEKRTLEAAVKFYCDKELVNAHTALADAVATLEVLKAQTVKYDELSSDVSFLSEFSKINQSSVDYAGRIVLNKENVPIINFGKHKGKSVIAVFEKEPGYYAWIMRGDFSQNTKRCFTKIWEENKK